MSEDNICVFYMSSTRYDGRMENPKDCGNCNGHNTLCPFYYAVKRPAHYEPILLEEKTGSERTEPDRS